MLLVTGGAGFIGANFILQWFKHKDEAVLNLDALTYAGNPENLHSIEQNDRYTFVHGDITDAQLLQRLFTEYRPRALIHFAAESHVDRSIHGPETFVRTNVMGTQRLLEAARKHWGELQGEEQENFRFVHISTDEVYGTLAADEPPFSETTPYAPNSPYAASKAGSDHLVRAYYHTYGLPVITTNCSNNYGPYQFPEKLIPLVIANALQGKLLPIYGDGQQVRDWLYVEDHCRAILRVLEAGRLGETYNIGGGNEMANIDIVKKVCALLDQYAPATRTNLKHPETGSELKHYAELITFVKDRPGHDSRYAIDACKIEQELDWEPQETFTTGIDKTVRWYLDNQEWVEHVQNGSYRQWIEQQYHTSGKEGQG